MKWDFFYDEGKSNSYRSLKDWFKDIRHLIVPLVIMGSIILAIYFYKFL